MRVSCLGLLFAGVLAAAAMPASAQPMAAGLTITNNAASAFAAEALAPVQYYYYGPPRRYYGGPRYYYRHGGYYRRGWRGDGVAAGLAAGAIGALAIGGLAASGAFDPGPRYAPMAPPRKQWCANRFRSYNPADGTYIDSRGRVRFCG